MSDIKSVKRAKGAPWALALAIVVTVLWTLASLKSLMMGIRDDLIRLGPSGGVMSPSIAGYVIGGDLVRAGLVWIALYFLVLRRKAPGRGLAYFLILWAVAVGIDVTLIVVGKSAADRAYVEQTAENNTAVAQIGDSMRTLLGPTLPAGRMDTKPKAKREAGQVEGITKQLIAELIEDERDCQAKLKALQYPDFLTPVRLASAGGLRDARERLAQAKEVIGRCRAANDDRMTNFPGEVAKSDLDADDRRRYLEGYARGQTVSEPDRIRSWDIDDRVLAELGAQVTLLSHPRGRWEARGQKVLFENRADMNEFNTHRRNVQALGQEEAALKQQYAQRFEQSLRELEVKMNAPPGSR